MVQVGLFGGTFNPVHWGHLRAAEEVYEAFNLSKVIFVPTNLPPHKDRDDVIAASHRMKMLELALEENPHFSISDVELKRGGTSYSIETIQCFTTTERRDVRLFFIIGIDAFLEIQLWKDYKELFSLCDFIVMSRPPYDVTTPQKMIPSILTKEFSYEPEQKRFVSDAATSIYFRNVTPLDISSHQIRRLLKDGRSIKYLVAKKVEDYIKEKGLYIHHVNHMR